MLVKIYLQKITRKSQSVVLKVEKNRLTCLFSITQQVAWRTKSRLHVLFSFVLGLYTCPKECKSNMEEEAVFPASVLLNYIIIHNPSSVDMIPRV